jgi:hypothetical protein
MTRYLDLDRAAATQIIPFGTAQGNAATERAAAQLDDMHAPRDS